MGNKPEYANCQVTLHALQYLDAGDHCNTSSQWMLRERRARPIFLGTMYDICFSYVNVSLLNVNQFKQGCSRSVTIHEASLPKKKPTSVSARIAK